MELLFSLLGDGFLFLLPILIALFIFVNVRRTLKDVEQRKRASASLTQPNRMVTVAIKTILFLIFYGLNVSSLTAGNKAPFDATIQSVTATSCYETYLQTGNKHCDKYAVAIDVLGQNALDFTAEAVAWNVFCGLYLFVCYFYFNIQLSFAALILLFSSRNLNGNEYNVFMESVLISCAIAVGVVFYKAKKHLLNAIRHAFLKLGGRGVVRIIEFYLICLPYFAFSLALSAMLGMGNFNIFMQLALIHTLAYFTIYRLYSKGCDIGFDYDPW